METTLSDREKWGGERGNWHTLGTCTCCILHTHTLCMCVSPSSSPVVNAIMLLLLNMLLSSLLLNSQGLVPFHTWPYPVLFNTAAASSSPSSSTSRHVCGLYVHRCVHVCMQVHTPVCSCKQAKEDIRWPTLSLSALLP